MNMDDLSPEVIGRIEEILAIVNKMPLDKEQRLTFAKHLVAMHITESPAEKWTAEEPEVLTLTREQSAVPSDDVKDDHN